MDGRLGGFLGCDSVGVYIFPSKLQSALRSASKPSNTQLVKGFMGVDLRSSLKVRLKGKEDPSMG